MKAVISSVVLAALLGFANAKVELTNSNFDDIEAGSTFEITWDDAEGPVTLTLKNGSEDNLQTVETITSGASGSSYVWSVDSDLVSGDYAIEITDGVDVNYSQMFPVAGTDAPSSTASSTVTITRTSTTASSTSSSESTTTTSEESTSTEATSTETSSSESTTSSESSSATTSSESTTTTASSSSVTRTTTSEPSATESDAPDSTIPNSNDAQSMAAPLIPGILALLGAALI
ncbi:Ser-Thr-rich glycosyl-phosphatidyl-inositol-anchored membrane family-domain-containing protein [Xylaria bambusicola]|uniref:Ser-Thr-rich glycosyl-phosphatidyl-inositol-anchored membrane family-domain-containing protein n=1 Tax=Xylaria bambusicola TaxID=326684 RepID=UPI002008A252|nr:Ser-Thr-rich glycosyl-phosphatidyl-inositol-anchored membrane family-domain-containing protein [Xylaria bambusicola]KAI0512471.1 Ser-Thr-rich glycosyl-phosphatidyl-inositol-anchored membrane family-domain-containing protein [Xylaria bambusicola]